MTAGRRLTDLFAVVGMLLLVGSVAGTGWWMTRPTPLPDVPLPDPSLMDVVCTGRVDAAETVIPLVPVQAGRVVTVAVADGEMVKKGAILLRTDDTAARSQLTQAEAALEIARVDLHSAEQDARRYPDQLAARDQLLMAAVARVEAARSLLQQRQEQSAVTPLGKAELAAIQARIKELVALEAAERGQVADLRQLDPEWKVRVARARLQAAEADLALAQQAVRETVVMAPTDGTILRVQAAVGGMVSPASPIPPIVFAPAGPYVIRAEVEQEFLSRVRVGMKTQIQDESRSDGPIWNGRVSGLAPWVAQKRSFLLDPGEINDVRTVECVIELESPSGLWIGQRVRVRMKAGE
ncbi:MAG: biotin/lipoyl-binding protein [Bacteroidales bacterium]|nr:biotin/lipoyl-binding protein [Bacteroidales bacterium]